MTSATVNKLKGTVTETFGGVPYTLVFDHNALCDLEGAMGGKPIAEIVEPWFDAAGEILADRVPISAVRGLLWAGLQTHHPEVDLRAAGRMLEELGTSGAMARILAALVAAFPEPSKGPNGGDANAPGNPRNRAARRRAGSGKKGSASGLS